MSYIDKFRAKAKFQILEQDADQRLITNGKDKAADKLAILALSERLMAFQNILWAEKKHKILIILQGMDTSGKDGTVRSVFSQFNPLGARSYGFKAPSQDELAHDYLWRVHQQVPAFGEIVIFNRSHYEDVLITRVHEWIDTAEVKRRYAQISDFERMLSETGTTIMKFFLHISKDVQKERLEERIVDPDKHWKFDMQDMVERESWDAYQSAYADAINATNRDYAPWFVIPANSKTQRNLAIANILVEKLESMKLAYPAGNPELAKIKIK
jgi:PPK2 family polyphosphate:nucleotide phosphotransferase